MRWHYQQQGGRDLIINDQWREVYFVVAAGHGAAACAALDAADRAGANRRHTATARAMARAGSPAGLREG